MAEYGGQTSGSAEDMVLNKEVERVTKTTIADILLKGYQRDRIEVVANGSEFQTFVRLRYPTSELRKAPSCRSKQKQHNGFQSEKDKSF
jgi:hypothetical protein